MITISAPGKLMLSGEWSVLEKEVPCIVLAVNQRVFATIESSDNLEVILKDFNVKSLVHITDEGIEFESDEPALKFTAFAMKTSFNYLKESNIPIKPFRLETTAEITTVNNEKGEEMKVGFGSSAAAVVAIIGAILHFHQGLDFSDAEKDLIYKLGVIAHFFGQGKLGSGFDVAASTFGGAVVYKRFDPDWLQEELEKNTISDVISKEWPLLEHRNISIPQELRMLVGFTGVSASTRKLVQEMRNFKENDPKYYYEIISSIKEVTERLIEAFENEMSHAHIISLLEKNRILLEELSFACSCHLEIQPHQVMSQIASNYGAVAKFSGAGGGDCSVGVCFSEEVARAILREWQIEGIMLIDIEITNQGIRFENS